MNAANIGISDSLSSFLIYFDLELKGSKLIIFPTNFCFYTHVFIHTMQKILNLYVDLSC
jgi:hypothetical protein